MPGFDKEIARLAQRTLIAPRKIDFHTGVLATKVTPGTPRAHACSAHCAAGLPSHWGGFYIKVRVRSQSQLGLLASLMCMRLPPLAEQTLHPCKDAWGRGGVLGLVADRSGHVRPGDLRAWT